MQTERVISCFSNAEHSVCPGITAKHFELHQNILRDLGHSLTPGARVLDFGCGKGSMVDAYRQNGYEAWGCDVKLDKPGEFLRPIKSGDAALPFPDNYFDFVFSDQVLEHVQEHEVVLSEMHRVMRPKAISLHIFPSKLKPTEAHIFVPFAGLIQNRTWLSLWALLGIRNSFQKGKNLQEVVQLNSEFLKQQTRYLSKAEIIDLVTGSFGNIKFAERFMIKHSYGHAHRIYPIIKLIPPLASLYSTFYSRVIFFQKDA
jgi:ubiquinone/menaquinone biosynthesis C-methylase UbiE